MYNALLYNQPLYNLVAQSSPFHFLLDGSYQQQSYPINRVLVIGRDADGNHVVGADEEATEIALVGERLDLQYHPPISTATLAAQVADAVLAKARLQTKDGFITLPPNCGVELFDVITVYDQPGCQQGVSFRVAGIRLVFNALEGVYQQQLKLGEV